MMNLIELVPRSLESVTADAAHLLTQYSHVNGINIPDVRRLPIRSYDVAKVFLSHGYFVVPHIRSVDFTAETAIILFDELVGLGLTHVLVVSGDVYPELAHDAPLTAIEMITLLKRRFPQLIVYGALDPYRTSAEAELSYCHQKLGVGCDGFFTQPFFDLELSDWYLSRLTQTQLFLGISPVLTEKSKTYWTVRNHVTFSDFFQLDLRYNLRLAHDLMALAGKYNQHTYHMPITMDAREYVGALWPT